MTKEGRFSPKEPNSALGIAKTEKKQTKKLLKRKTNNICHVLKIYLYLFFYQKDDITIRFWLLHLHQKS